MAQILLVEDDENLASMFGDVLREHGHEVAVAANGEAAIERVFEHPPDFVLMDIQMPILDGIEATRRLKDSVHKDIPIVALTNLQLPEEISTALEAGCDGYITKPDNPADLIDELRLLLNPEPSTEQEAQETSTVDSE